MGNLRALAWRGGITLAVRQVMGMAISFAGLVALARLIGAQAYGVYVSAFALHTWLVLLFQWGVDVYLIRSPDEPAPDERHQAFTLALALGGLGAALAWPAGVAAQAWIGADGVSVAVTTLFLGMPLQLATQVPSALLQRRMAYRRVAWAELAGQGALYGGGVFAALVLDWGLAAPLAGWWLQQVVMAALFFTLAGYRPALLWRWQLARRMVRFGASYAASVWSWRLRDLANPLIIARILGPETAANVAVALRLVEALSFMKTVLWRVSLPAMGRMQSDRSRLARAVSEGMRLQVLAIGPALLGFSLVAPWLVPLAFGKDWGATTAIFPFLALAWLVNGVFSLHGSALYVLHRAGDVTIFHLAHAGVLLAVAAVAVPRWGLAGYGMAELAAVTSYAVLHVLARRRLGTIPIGLGVAWCCGFAVPLFADMLGPAAWAGPAVILALPATRRVLAGWWVQIREAAHG